MSINLPLNFRQYPIRPEHIKADMLFKIAEQIIRLCQRSGGWYPFRVHELEGATSYQLRHLIGIIQVHDRFYISHGFVLHMLTYAPAVDGKEQKQLIADARNKAHCWIYEQTWHRLPELILVGTWLCAGLLNSFMTDVASLADAMKEMFFWPISPNNLASLALWLSISFFCIVWLLRQQKVICLTPTLSWYQKPTCC